MTTMIPITMTNNEFNKMDPYSIYDPIAWDCSNNNDTDCSLLNEISAMFQSRTESEQQHRQQLQHENIREAQAETLPSSFDIICGRGKGVYDRPANKQFREQVHSSLTDYMNAKTKVDKSIVITNVIETILDSNEQQEVRVRFVKKDALTRAWVELSYEEVREKVGHAMRAAVQCIKDDESRIRRIECSH